MQIYLYRMYLKNKDVTEADYFSVFWVSLGVAIVLYGALKKIVLSNLIWRFAARCGTQIAAFVVSIVLACILDPNALI